MAAEASRQGAQTGRQGGIRPKHPRRAEAGRESVAERPNGGGPAAEKYFFAQEELCKKVSSRLGSTWVAPVEDLVFKIVK